MSFLRHRKSIVRWAPKTERRSDIIAPPNPSSDEFPPGYSSAGCTPAAPASASPGEAIMDPNRRRHQQIAADGKLSLISVSQRRGAVQFLG